MLLTKHGGNTPSPEMSHYVYYRGQFKATAKQMGGKNLLYTASFQYIMPPTSLSSSSLDASTHQEKSGRIATSEVGLVDRHGSDLLRGEGNLIASIIDTVGALIVLLDPSGQIVRFNRACERLSGYKSEEVKRRKIGDLLVPPSELDSVQTVFERLVSDRLPCEHENHWITKNGELRLISWSSTVLLNEQGRVAYVVSTGLDVTERRQLERRIVETSEDERRRIGHDLHELLCNHLAGTALIVEAASASTRKGGQVSAAELEQISDLVSQAVEHARVLSRRLVPVKIEEEGLLAALEELLRDVQNVAGVDCSFYAADDFPEVAHMGVANHLFRIAEEAVTNAYSHAQPEHIVVELSMADDSLVLTVGDDGIGITEDPCPDGLGIHMMRYRTRLIGGTFSIAQRPRGGTEVRCVAPFA